VLCSACVQLAVLYLSIVISAPTMTASKNVRCRVPRRFIASRISSGTVALEPPVFI
jgi:hypothetical protein